MSRVKLPLVRAEQTELPGHHASHIIKCSSPPSILPHQHPSSSLAHIQPHSRDTTAPSHPHDFGALGCPTASPHPPQPAHTYGIPSTACSQTQALSPKSPHFTAHRQEIEHFPSFCTLICLSSLSSKVKANSLKRFSTRKGGCLP